MKYLKRILLKLFKMFVSLLPYRSLIRFYNRLKEKRGDMFSVVESLLRDRLFDKSSVAKNFEKTIRKANKKNKWCIIQKLNWNYSYINVCFISEVLSLVIWCLENGYKPAIDVITKGTEDENLWEKMFIQPFDADIKRIKESGNYFICPIDTFLFPSIREARDANKVNFWHKMYKEYVRFNDSCQRYLDDEFNTLIKGKKVLGCLIRGIEYDKARLKYHPIQPSIEEFISKIKEVLAKEDLEYIYLATEDHCIAQRVKEEFDKIVIENRRQYYDERYRNDAYLTTKEIYDREDGAFLKALEYFSSINLLSKCDSFVAGLCGGSEAAEYFNGNRFKTNYLFDKGEY